MTTGPGSAIFDALVQHAETQSATAVGFQQLLATLSSLDRDLVSDRIAELREELTASTEQLEPEEVPEGAEAASALFDLALEEWDAGLAAFDTSLLAVADDPESEEAVEGLAGAIQRIAVGDLLYRRFLEESEGLRSDLDVAIASTYPGGQLHSGAVRRNERRSQHRRDRPSQSLARPQPRHRDQPGQLRAGSGAQHR